MVEEWLVIYANPIELSGCGPLDRAAVLDRLGGDAALLREITAIFLAEYPDLVRQIRNAIDRGNARELEHAAHTLKGAVSNFAVEPATRAALTLELIGRQGRLAEADPAFDTLLEQFRKLEPLLEKLLQ